jgi:hypothetical protein
MLAKYLTALTDVAVFSTLGAPKVKGSVGNGDAAGSLDSRAQSKRNGGPFGPAAEGPGLGGRASETEPEPAALTLPLRTRRLIWLRICQFLRCDGSPLGALPLRLASRAERRGRRNEHRGRDLGTLPVLRPLSDGRDQTYDIPYK